MKAGRLGGPLFLGWDEDLEGGGIRCCFVVAEVEEMWCSGTGRDLMDCREEIDCGVDKLLLYIWFGKVERR